MNAKLTHDDSTLGAYLRQMSGFDLMTAEEELAAATRIAELRSERWRSILSYAPRRAALVDLVEATLGEGEPRLDLAELRGSMPSESALDAAAGRLASRDTDGVVADRVIADLAASTHDDEASHTHVADLRRCTRRLACACRRFAEANLRLVVYIARQLARADMPLQDLIQEGNIGLMKAIDRFDHRRGCRFSTYASWWIRHNIGRAIADHGRTVRVPVHMQSAYGKVARARSRIDAEGRDGSNEEVAAATGLSPSRIERMSAVVLQRAVSLDQEIVKGRTLVDSLADESLPPPMHGLESEAALSRVRQALERLRPMEADILRRRFGLGGDSKLTCSELGKHYSLSRERVRQVQVEALKKIRRELRDLDMR